MASAPRNSLEHMRIDQHSPGGKALQQAVQTRLKEYMGADYSDEVLLTPRAVGHYEMRSPKPNLKAPSILKYCVSK